MEIYREQERSIFKLFGRAEGSKVVYSMMGNGIGTSHVGGEGI